MRFLRLILALGLACAACGDDNGKTDGGGDGGGDAAADATAEGGSLSAQCLSEVDAVIDGGCTRCWPAGRAMCDQGNPGALLGMLHCLTNDTCWDEGDPNTAGPCMQNVIGTYGDANVAAIATATQSLGCSSDFVLLWSAVATEMSDADRKTFAACIEQISFDGGSCVEAPFDACLAQTHYDATLCQN